jgi:hypothetical protein
MIDVESCVEEDDSSFRREPESSDFKSGERSRRVPFPNEVGTARRAMSHAAFQRNHSGRAGIGA